MICRKKKRTPEQALIDVFNSLDIETHKKTVLKDRYLSVLDNFHKRANNLTISFYSARMIVTVGSILVPAFLSIQTTSVAGSFYWMTWVISLAVTIANGFITLFKLDKKYFFIHTTLEMMHSEVWQYIGLTGRYSPKDATIVPTHENQFNSFFRMSERIKMRQVEEEFWKFTDTSGIGNASTHNTLLTSASPATQQGDLASLSNDKKTIIEGWLEDMKKTPNAGLQPRVNYSSRRLDSRLSVSRIDEGEDSPRPNTSKTKTSPGIFTTPLDPPLSMQFGMQPDTPPKESVLQDSPGSATQNTIIQVLPNESDERE
jgi:hypothetical protein